MLKLCMPCADSEHIELALTYGRSFGAKAGKGIEIIAPLGKGVANVLHLIGRRDDICPGDLYIVIQECSYDRLSMEKLANILPMVDEAYATDHGLELQDGRACPGCIMCKQQSSSFACEACTCCSYTLCQVDRLDCQCTHQHCTHCAQDTCRMTAGVSLLLGLTHIAWVSHGLAATPVAAPLLRMSDVACTAWYGSSIAAHINCDGHCQQCLAWQQISNLVCSA